MRGSRRRGKTRDVTVVRFWSPGDIAMDEKKPSTVGT
jgi:hypothetical protein